MITEKVKIGSTYYNLYTITVFKGTQLEEEVCVASERLNKRIEREILRENYQGVRSIDERFEYWVPKEEETNEDTITESIENVIISDMPENELKLIRL